MEEAHFPSLLPKLYLRHGRWERTSKGTDALFIRQRMARLHSGGDPTERNLYPLAATGVGRLGLSPPHAQETGSLANKSRSKADGGFSGSRNCEKRDRKQAGQRRRGFLFSRPKSRLREGNKQKGMSSLNDPNRGVETSSPSNPDSPARVLDLISNVHTRGLNTHHNSREKRHNPATATTAFSTNLICTRNSREPGDRQKPKRTKFGALLEMIGLKKRKQGKSEKSTTPDSPRVNTSTRDGKLIEGGENTTDPISILKAQVQEITSLVQCLLRFQRFLIYP